MVLALPVFSQWRLSNADITIVAQRPKLGAFKKQMQQRLSEVMNIHADRIAVKATTTEKMGFTGRGEGIAASAVVSLVR